MTTNHPPQLRNRKQPLDADDHVELVRRALQCRGVEKRYRSESSVPALGGVDLDVERGEWVAIMGPSGSGKSTLLNIIAGLDTPDAGSVTVDGEEITGLPKSDRAVMRRTRVGIVLQSLNLLGDLSAVKNVELPLRLAGVRKSEARRRAERLLDLLELGDLGTRLPSQLSGGQQQRVAIARALANKPTVLLADEPTGALDRNSATEVLTVLKRAHQAGQTLIVVTHDQRVASYADRIVRMEDGLIS
jgi:putative ABC transport system ATP-binding protein